MQRTTQILILLVALAVAAASCGGADSGDSDTTADGDDVSRAAGTLGDADLSLVVTELASGFGNLGRSEQRTLQGIADGDSVCENRAGPRADPEVSQVEVEIVTVVAGCLQFTYDVANFASFVDDIQDVRRGRDVLAASPMLLEYRLNQIESQWPVEAIEGLNLLQDAQAPTGRGITIAIIDSGIDARHQSLVAADIERAPDSGSGDYAETGHGTIAAAIIVAPIGTADRAIAPEVRLLDVPADLCDAQTCGCDPCASMTPAEAIRWSADNGANVISMSFGYQPAPKPRWWQLLLDAGELDSATSTIEVALAYARFQGVAMTAAAGNCSGGTSRRCETVDQFEIPAGHRSVIGVGAIEADDAGDPAAAWYSTRQSYVELAAPGNLAFLGADGKPTDKTGTSYATPFVTGALAVLLGEDGPLAGQPDSYDIARALLVESADDLAPEGRDPAVGHGRLQLDAALEAARDYAIANPAPAPTPGQE